HAADEHHLAARLDAVGVALRLRPARRLQHLGGAWARRNFADGFRHRKGSYEASLRARWSTARRRSSKRCSLPVCVFGSSATNATARGYLYGAMVALT